MEEAQHQLAEVSLAHRQEYQSATHWLGPAFLPPAGNVQALTNHLIRFSFWLTQHCFGPVLVYYSADDCSH